MTQLVYKQNFKTKKRYRFSIVSHRLMNRSQSALHVTDNSHMKDVLQSTAAIVMASSANKKIRDFKSLKTTWK